MRLSDISLDTEIESCEAAATAVRDNSRYAKMRQDTRRLMHRSSVDLQLERENDETTTAPDAKRDDRCNQCDSLSNVRDGHEKCFDSIVDRDFQKSDPSVCARLAHGDKLNLLKYARAVGFEWNSSTCRAAADAGHLRCLRYAHQNGCPWNHDVYEVSMKKKSFDCFRYAYEHKCPLVFDRFVSYLIKFGSEIEIFRYVLKKDFLKTSNAKTLIWDSLCYKFQHKTAVLWLDAYLEFEKDFEFRAKHVADIARFGRDESLLRHVHRRWPQVAVVWNEKVTAAAAGAGKLDTLRYARQNGCPWSALTVYSAIINNHDDAMRYACENGCPLSAECCRRARDESIRQYLHEHNCPCLCSETDTDCKDDDPDACIICYSRLAAVTNKPCGHRIACFTCTKQWRRRWRADDDDMWRPPTCAMCRTILHN